MMALDIFFQFGEFISHGSNVSVFSWWELIKALSFLSVPCAIYLYFKKRSDDKEEAEEKKRKENENDVKYFNTVIDDILKDIPSQINDYEKYADDLKREPYKTHALGIVSPENLNRIVNKFDQQQIFHSYINQFNEQDKDKAIKSFMELYKSLDTYLIIYNNAITVNEKLNEFVARKTNDEYLKIFTKNITSTLYKLHIDIEIKKELKDVLDDILKSSQQEKRTLDFWQEFLVKRVIEERELFETHHMGKEILTNCHVITAIYKTIVSNSNTQSDTMIRLASVLTTVRSNIEYIKSSNLALMENK
jgi:hypothetical protein